jgi:hypothetical protein
MQQRRKYGAVAREVGAAIMPILIDSPKRLETPVTQTKQTTEVISNRMKIEGTSDAMTEAKSDVARVSCPVYLESRRDEGRVRPEAFEFSAKLKDGAAEKTNGPKSLTSEEVSYVAQPAGMLVML